MEKPEHAKAHETKSHDVKAQKPKEKHKSLRNKHITNWMDLSIQFICSNSTIFLVLVSKSYPNYKTKFNFKKTLRALILKFFLIYQLPDTRKLIKC